MSANIANPPVNTSLIQQDPNNPTRKDPFPISKDWLIWLQQSLVPRAQAGTQVLKAVTATAQSASILTTPFSLSTIPSGLYRINWYIRVTQAATTNSSLTLTFGWTETAQALTASGAAMTGNSVTTLQSGSAFFRSDVSSPITYAAAYASTGATPMIFRMDLVIELVY